VGLNSSLYVDNACELVSKAHEEMEEMKEVVGQVKGGNSFLNLVTG
jgi:hypothetical protein